MSKLFKHARWITVSLCSVFLFAYSAQASTTIASHQAVYDFALKSASAAAEVNTINGKSHYMLKKVCDGWSSAENYAISFGFEEGQNSNFISHYKTWEAADGTSFTYEIIENSNISGESAKEGFAQKTDRGIEAFFVGGDGAMEKLPTDTVFPVAHLRSILEKAKQGTPVISQSHMFLGGDETDSLYFISALIGKIRDDAPTAALAQTMGDLVEETYWPLTIAYYKPDAQDAEPDYAITFELQSNGIIRGYTVDYGTFRMQAKLTKLMPVEVESCVD